MYGAIIGDIIGSRFEFDRGDKSKEFELFTKECDFTDDTVMTIAVAEALMDAGKDADEKTVKDLLIKSMKKWGKKYPYAGYGARFIDWVLTDDPKPYGSYGNGSGMRVSAVGWLYDTLDRTREVARWTAEVTHNHPEGIKGAEATAAAIFMARTGSKKEEIAGYIEDEFGYDLSRTLDEIRPTYEHVEDCMHTMPEAFECFFEANSYEDTLRNVMYIGGDTDTLCAIAGAIAEAYWGIPQEILDRDKDYLPQDILDVALRFMNTVIEAEHDEKYFTATDSGLRYIPPKRINDRKWSTTGGAAVPVDINKIDFISYSEMLEQKHSGFDAPVYGRLIQDDEELVLQPNGNYKLVKKNDKENKGITDQMKEDHTMEDIDSILDNPAAANAVCEAMGLANLSVIAPHKSKYYNRYNIQWLIDEINSGEKFSFFTFWQADKGCENRIFSQWYNNPFVVNGRTYVTAEQYMMSEKALLFGDLDSYKAIMNEPNPKICKQLGRGVKNFDSKIWSKSFREIIFHGNLGKLQSDLSFVDALLSTGDAVLIEASPTDDIYGAGLDKNHLLNADGTLKTLPQDWHKKGSDKQAENNLGFVLMGIRDLFNDLMKKGNN